MFILGISAFYHDSAACLIEDGVIVAAAQEERFTRIKHDSAYPAKAVEYCLLTAGITSKELSCVVFYDKPFLKFERILETHLTYAPRSFTSFLRAIPIWIKEKVWVKDIIARELDYDGDILFPEHHMTHAASAFYPSPYSSAAILTIDGVGEWSTTTIAKGEGNKIEMLEEIRFPHSLGLLYSAFTYYTGFKVNSGEYKVMGLAPYGRPVYKDLILRHLIDLRDDGSFRLNMKYFSYGHGLRMTNKAFDRLFGGPRRKPESDITQREMDLARSIQEVVEEAVLKIAIHAKSLIGSENLCLAGGVALNCVSNGKLLREGIFENIWIQPAAGDAGGAVGAAMYGWYAYHKNNRPTDGVTDAMKGSLLGPEYSDDEIAAAASEMGVEHVRFDDRHAMIEDAVGQLASEKVVGWFQGRMEFGPRALGSRSILGDARSPKLQEVMNLKIKFRESFRPFAPIVTLEHCKNYFDLQKESPYMLIVAPVNEDRRKIMTQEQEALFGIQKLNVERSDIPAVTHVDYSARVQTVTESTNPALYQLLSKMNDVEGSPILINTSFNVRGEPIVMTPKDAIRCFLRTGIDALYLGNIGMYKNEQSVKEDTSWMKEFQLD